MSVSSFLKSRLTDLVETHRIVVWFDGEGHFSEFVGAFKARGTKVVLAKPSRLCARREADAFLADLEDPNAPNRKANMLLYLPWERAKNEQGRHVDPFEGYVAAGVVFGDKEADRLQVLARMALPNLAGEVDRLFAEGRPTLTMLDGLAEGGAGRLPLLRSALGIEAPVEAAEKILVMHEAAGKLAEVDGAREELLRLLGREFGFESPEGATDLPSTFGRFILFSEFAFDLTQPLPEALSGFPRAGDRFRPRVFELCDRLRSSPTSSDAYARLASATETDLGLAAHFPDPSVLGRRDTFPFEERAWMGELVRLARAGRRPEARAVLEARHGSLWSERGGRAVLWKLAERCLDFLEAAARFDAGFPRGASVAGWVEAYTKPEGLYLLDLHQRRVEQGAAACGESGETAPLVALCRRTHRRLTEQAQEGFLGTVVRDGWPPEGILRQTQVFDRFVAPPLEDRRRTVYLLVDALRFEMGADLRASLESLGEVSLYPAVTVLPTTTPCGMAALMPGADGAFALLGKDGDLIPSVRGRALPDSASRMALLREAYGDRFGEMTLGDFLSATLAKLQRDVEGTDLLVIRTQDLDALGENVSLYEARRHMSGTLEDIRVVCERLARLGFQRLILAADHGHVLLPEVPPGDVVSEAPGDWDISKRRCRLGQHRSSATGVIVISAQKLGIQGPVAEMAFPSGFCIFKAGQGYFHEGISLQECVVPVLVVDVALRQPEPGKPQIGLHYRSDRITSRVASVRAQLTSLFQDASVEVRIQVFEGSGARAKKIGEAADCDARDPATGLVTLKGEEAQIPVRIADDYLGEELEVRAIDLATGTALARLKLKCSFMD
jgi:hypothetical protein